MIIFYLKTILLLLCSFNFFIPKIILLILLYYCIITLYHNKHNYKITVHDLRVNNVVIYCLLTLLFCLIYIVLFSYWRYLNLTKQVDLKIIVYNLYLVLKTNNLFNNVIIISYSILCILIIYLSISMLRKYFFIHFFKIHLYITYLTCKKDIIEETFYDKLRFNLVLYSDIFSRIFINKPIKLLYKLIKRYDTIYSKSESEFFIDIIYKFRLIEHEEWFPRYILILCFIYDIIYNNMIITKIYYILLILSLYYIYQQAVNIICFMYKGDCIRVYYYLYKNTSFNDVLDELDIKRINIDLEKIKDVGKPGFPVDYKEKILYNIDIQTYFFIINIAMMLYILITKNVQIFYSQYFVDIYLISLVILYVLILSWFFFDKLFFKCGFICLTFMVNLCWLTLFLRHNVPLLFNEIIINNKYIYIIDTYTIQEKTYFFIEYIKYHINDHTIVFNIPLTNIRLVYNSIFELKLHAKDLILLIKKIELAYENHFSRLLIKTIMEILNENIINPVEIKHNSCCSNDFPRI